MALTVNSNIASLNAQRNLSGSTNALTTAMERLSSGSRINSAKDDAAGLQISNRLTSQINGLNVAVRNANNGISMAQTAEGALQESTEILQRIRELTLQAGDGAMGEEDRDSLQLEVDALSAELDRINEKTSFGSTGLFDGSFGTDGAVTFQVGAYAGDTISVDFGNNAFNATTLLGAATAAGSFDITDVSALDDRLGTLDDAIAAVDTKRAELGAVQSRFESTISNLQNVSENVSASRSRIMDTDYAVETANLTKNQIMQQAGTAMLSQANQLPQAVLSLLG